MYSNCVGNMCIIYANYSKSMDGSTNVPDVNGENVMKCMLGIFMNRD